MVDVPYPEGEVRWYGGSHKVRILPAESFSECKQPYTGYTSKKIESRCYPCLVMEDFMTTRSGKVFKAGDKVVLAKCLLPRKHRSQWKR